MHQFLDYPKLTKVNQDEIDNLNHPITILKIENMILRPSEKEISRMGVKNWRIVLSN